MLYLRLLVAALFASVRARRDLVLENLALRHQLAVCTRGRRRPRPTSPRPPMLVTTDVTEHPNAPWIWQQMIEATAWGQQPGFLI